MSTQMQLRGGTTAENLLFTGAQREVTIDTDRHAIIVHDGVTAGGYAAATSPQVTNGTFYFNDNTGGGSASNAYILTPKSNTNTPTQYADGIQLGFVTTNANATGPSTANFSTLGVKSIKYPGGIDPAAGDISGRVYLIYDAANGWFELQRKVTGAPPQVRVVTASVSGNALIVQAPAATVDFRSTSLNSGAVNSRTFTTSLVASSPAGASLGTANNVLGRIAILYIDNAGTVELGLTNASNSSISFDESALINTVAMTAASTSANVVYSATSLVGVPYRVAGYVESTQAIAGTWSTPPSKVQGQGGQSLIGLVMAKSGSGTAQPTTSGTSVDLIGIPSWAKRVTLIMNGVSTNGTSPLLVQTGAGSIQTTGYSCATGNTSTTVNNNTSAQTSTAGLPVTINIATGGIYGTVSISNISGSIWVLSAAGYSLTGSVFSGGGGVSLSGVLDRIRVTTVNGTDVFDAGSINVFYEG